MRATRHVPIVGRMTRHALAALTLSAAVAVAVAPSAAPAMDAPPSASAAAVEGKKKTRAQKLRACLKKANRKSGAARRRARSSCQAKYGSKSKVTPPSVVPPGTPAVPQGPAAPSAPVPPPPPPPAVDPVRDDAKFREALKSSYLHRQYQVPKPNHGIGFNYHDENYEFCQSIMGHFYEGISYIYKTAGPWEVVEGSINGDGTKATGTIRFTQAQANFAEEIGKVQTIQIQWAGDQVQIAHPEIGTNAFTRQVKPAPCTQ